MANEVEPFHWYAYISPSPGEIEVVGQGSLLDTFESDLIAIAKAIGVNSSPTYLHVVSFHSIKEQLEILKNGAHPVTIYRCKKVKGEILVRRKDGELWVNY